MPPPVNRFVYRVSKGSGVRVYGDLMEGLGFDGVERRDDPADGRSFTPKRQISEFHGLGEVDGR